ncbi:alpha/beta hydrolase [Parafilimonas sp.]|uniref:alpha/beta hydrolase n=1 Tax=Parafilimonas sp. TaxID=1969739 RepID=UPI0039E53949
MHKEIIIQTGNINNATKALIMLHGRGGSAEDILSLATHLNVKAYALFAPQAANNTWYPYSFLAPPRENEPWLSAALELVGKTVDAAMKRGIAKKDIYFMGFSQGACLALEFIARHAAKYGGAVIFTGGLIGDKIYAENYKGNFDAMPVFIGTSDPDFHVPAARVYATTHILKNMGADVTEKVYNNMGHTIIKDEIDLANELVFK